MRKVKIFFVLLLFVYCFYFGGGARRKKGKCALCGRSTSSRFYGDKCRRCLYKKPINEETRKVKEDKEELQCLEIGIENLKNGLLKNTLPSYEPSDFKSFCDECNAGNTFSAVFNAMTSNRHSAERKVLNEKRTVAILNMMTFALSQKCNTFQHDHGQLLLRSGLSGNVLNSERVMGTAMCEREYQLIKTKDSSNHNKIVNEWIDTANQEEKLIVLNIDDYTNIHTKKRPMQCTSKSSKMCTILMKKYDVPAIKIDDHRPVNNPAGLLIDDLVSHMSSNEQVMKLCCKTFTADCQEDAPWITNRFFDPEYEQNRLTTHDYAVDIAVKKMRKMNDTMLIDCVELPLQKEGDFKTAIDLVMTTNLKEYCKKYVLPQPGDWPAQFYPRRIVYSSNTNTTLKSSFVPLLGPLHVSLNGQENVFKIFYELLRHIYQQMFGINKTLASDKCLPWRIALILELCYGGWSIIREKVINVFGDQCKDIQFLTLFNFLENYLPLVLTIYAVIFRSNNFQLYVSALKRIWLMFLCFGRHHYDKSPLVFLSSILYWAKIAHPILSAFQNSLLAFTEYPVEYFHSIIRDQTVPHTTAEQITKTCRSIFASKHRQENFRRTFLPTKNYTLSRNQLKAAKLKAAEVLKNIFYNIISKPHCGFSSKAAFGEKQEWTMPFLFGNTQKTDKVLPCGFHLASNKDVQPDPHRECDMQKCQKKNEKWRVLKGCGHSFHFLCVPTSTCPICQDGLQQKVREHATKAKEAVFSSSKPKKTPTKAAAELENDDDKDEVAFASLTDAEINKRANYLNLEIAAWPKYIPGNQHPSQQSPPVPATTNIKNCRTPKNKWDRDPQYGRHFSFNAERAIEEFVEKCLDRVPIDSQISHLLATDSRLAGETLQRVKRKITTLIKKKKEKTKETPTLSLPIPPWGGHFCYEGQRIEIVNSCPIDNLLTSFHLLFSSEVKFFDAFKSLPYQGTQTMLTVHEMFRNQQWSVGKVIWLTQVKLGVNLTSNVVNVWGGEDERFFSAMREVTENEIKSICSNPTCPARNLVFKSKGPITLNSIVTPPKKNETAIEVMLQQWLKPMNTTCMREWKDAIPPGTTHIQHIRTQSTQNDGSVIDKIHHHCSGTRTFVTRQFLNGTPIVLPLNVDYHCRQGTIKDANNLPSELEFPPSSGKKYQLRIVTFWEGSHYTCSVMLRRPFVTNSGWFFYDGIRVKNNGDGLVRCRNPPETPQGSLMSHAVYILNL